MIGKTISHYKILSKLGEGGMGVVYKAEDTKFERTVALKFLSLTSIGDEEKKRFKREAKAAASLNHPNIATIHAIDEVDEQTFIAMEYIEGKSLAELVGANGGKPMPIDKAIDYATQTAAGLQAAHEKGITHRDIKSANIMVTEKGQIKIMDFGLAKLANRSKMTQLGTTLGTAAYMSPEQSRGENTDHRSDIWSLGVVLYEMISAQMPFKGDYEQAVIYSIQNEEPEPLTALRSGLPIALDGIIAKALAKDASTRYQNVEELPADLKRIDKFSTSGTGISTQSLLQKGSARTGLKGRPWLVGVALLAGILLSSLWWWFKTPETILPVRKFQFSLSSILRNPWKRNAVISPDGSMIAFLESNRIWIRNLNELQPRELPGTKHADRLFWSPKSDFVAYLDTETPQFKKIAVAGGEPKTISDYQFAGGYGQDWGPDDNIVFAGSAEGLFRVSARGGQPELTIKSDTTKEVGIYAFPVYLPDGTLLATTYQASAVWRVVKITESKATPITGIPHDYLVNLAYSPTGHLLYNNDGGLWAVPFSSSKLEVIGEPLLIDPDGMGASISTEGTLVYTKNVKSSARLIWVDRRGRLLGKIGQPQGRIENPSISPDGSRIAVAGFENGNVDIWVYDVARGNRDRITNHPRTDSYPTWSPDGDTLIFETRRISDGALFKKASDSSGKAFQINTGTDWSYGPMWSADGRFLFYWCWVGVPGDKAEIRYLDLHGSTEPKKLLEGKPYIGNPQLSRDNKYLAYHSDESGQVEIYVTKFPDKDFKKKISIDGGSHPRWSRSGGELFYIEDDALVALKVDTRNGFRIIGQPERLFSADSLNVMFEGSVGFDVAPDGQRFVVVQDVGERRSNIVVVQNWLTEFVDKEE